MSELVIWGSSWGRGLRFYWLNCWWGPHRAPPPPLRSLLSSTIVYDVTIYVCRHFELGSSLKVGVVPNLFTTSLQTFCNWSLHVSAASSNQGAGVQKSPPGVFTGFKTNLPTNIVPINIAWLKLSGKSPMDVRIPPLWIQIMLESNPPKPTMIGGLGVPVLLAFEQPTLQHNHNTSTICQLHMYLFRSFQVTLLYSMCNVYIYMYSMCVSLSLYMYIYIYMYTYICIHIMHTYIYIYIYIHTYIHTYRHVCLSLSIYLYLSLSLYIYIYTHNMFNICIYIRWYDIRH